MKIQKAYKFRLIPTKQQEIQLSKEFGCARFVWNRALVEKEYAYQQWNVSLSNMDISKHITQYKKTDYPWLSDATSSVLTMLCGIIPTTARLAIRTPEPYWMPSLLLRADKRIRICQKFTVFISILLQVESHMLGKQ